MSLSIHLSRNKKKKKKKDLDDKQDGTKHKGTNWREREKKINIINNNNKKTEPMK